MKQYKIPIPDANADIHSIIYDHARFLGYWRNDNPDFTKGYVYLWKDGEITYADDEIVVDFEVIQWDDFMLLKREV